MFRTLKYDNQSSCDACVALRGICVQPLRIVIIWSRKRELLQQNSESPTNKWYVMVLFGGYQASCGQVLASEHRNSKFVLEVELHVNVQNASFANFSPFSFVSFYIYRWVPFQLLWNIDTGQFVRLSWAFKFTLSFNFWELTSTNSEWKFHLFRFKPGWLRNILYVYSVLKLINS